MNANGKSLQKDVSSVDYILVVTYKLSMNLLIHPQIWIKEYHFYSFTRMALAFNNPRGLICYKKTRKKQETLIL